MVLKIPFIKTIELEKSIEEIIEKTVDKSKNQLLI